MNANKAKALEGVCTCGAEMILEQRIKGTTCAAGTEERRDYTCPSCGAGQYASWYPDTEDVVVVPVPAKEWGL